MRYPALCAVAMAAATVLTAALDSGQTRAAGGTPAEMAQAIATACNEKRYSDAGEALHPSLRRTWIEIGYRVKDFCELITRNYTLADVRVDKEERVAEYAVVYVTYQFQDGAENADRSTFLQEKGAWKLVN